MFLFSKHNQCSLLREFTVIKPKHAKAKSHYSLSAMTAVTTFSLVTAFSFAPIRVVGVDAAAYDHLGTVALIA